MDEQPLHPLEWATIFVIVIMALLALCVIIERWAG